MVRNIIIRILLLPFAILYGIGISIRNLLYRWNVLKSVSFSMPVIGIGNLTVGGAGKTPHTEYLIRLLQDYIQLATLSRGYGRKTRGFLLAEKHHSALEIGDEPLQYTRKFPNLIVCVSESRALGIPKLLSLHPEIQTILLDDAFQHRAVKPGLQLLLTEYRKPYTKDWLLPVGRLREWPAGAERGDAIVVTKCPSSLSQERRTQLTQMVKRTDTQEVFFSYLTYGQPYNIFNPSQKRDLSKVDCVLLVSAIAQTDDLVETVSEEVAFLKELSFEDHHKFSSYEVANMIRMYEEMPGEPKIFLTTEKDAMRMELHRGYFLAHDIQVYALPVQVKFHESKPSFDAYIKQFLLDFER